ncbi:MAG: hypothetical protein GEV28_02655 [Actinophytocola sp.]|uniref:hypothetical protein n=1 Tax=Actinophytocola sp. TaxID=1872138 RepID=UPI00132B59DA|nr:hypothetical protein [Actinophytocola sp.]MPZ79336.1 hypothetical protein [Actinophytocola sp.]
MSAPPFELLFSDEANKVLDDLEAKNQYAPKLRKVNKALDLLEQAGPSYPGLRSHAYHSVPGPDGATLWESYVENKTPSAWRIWWIYGPDDGQLSVVTIGPHP